MQHSFHLTKAQRNNHKGLGRNDTLHEESFTPEDNEESDNEHHKLLRAIIKELITIEDEAPFTTIEI
jgi:hypothetical protein